jgi:hypothetical protein
MPQPQKNYAFLPIIKIPNAMEAAIAIINTADKLAFVCNIPIPAEIDPPIPICIKLSDADALPAFFANGLSATAAAFE